jgi:hypothetical protein
LPRGRLFCWPLGLDDGVWHADPGASRHRADGDAHPFSKSHPHAHLDPYLDPDGYPVRYADVHLLAHRNSLRYADVYLHPLAGANKHADTCPRDGPDDR